MKRNSILLYTLISIAFTLSSISSVELGKEKLLEKKDINVRPNSADLVNIVKPLIKTPYRPQEVDSLYNEKHKDDFLMTKAEILGSTDRKPGLVEKPTLYESVITSKPIGITHSNQFNNMAARFVPGHQINNFNTGFNLGNGQMALPVQLNAGGVINSSTLSNYETPAIVSNNQAQVNRIPQISPELFNTFRADTQKVQNRLAHATSRRDKLRALNYETSRLRRESESLRLEIKNQLDNLIGAKNVGVKLDNLLQKYAAKVQKDQKSQFPLLEKVEIRNQLKEKLIRDIQGFRTSAAKYNKIDKVNPKHLRKIINDIRNKLGY